MFKTLSKPYSWIVVILLLLVLVESFGFIERSNSEYYESYLVSNERHNDVEWIIVNIPMRSLLLINTILYGVLYGVYFLGRIFMKSQPLKMKYIYMNRIFWLIAILIVYSIIMLDDIMNTGEYLTFDLYYSILGNLLRIVFGAAIGLDYYQIIKKWKGQ